MALPLQQTEFFDREAETAAYLSADRVGFFSLLVNDGGKKRQSSHRLTDMPTVLRLVDQRKDSWVSQAEFFVANRRVVNLARVGLLFSDLDTYRTGWAQGKSPERQADAVLHFCDQEGIPEPSMLIYSGRGLQAKWLLDSPLPRQALPRWNACQKQLVAKLSEMGADPGARDASRVLRLVDTVNTKSGNVCQVVHVGTGPDGLPRRYGFEFMAETLLPLARWDIEAKNKAREERRVALELVHSQGGEKPRLRGFSGRQLAWDRLEDLRKLAELRGGVQEGERMLHMFWQLNFLLLSGATNSSLMYHEAAALAKHIDPNWGYQSTELRTLYDKAKAHEAGDRVEFNGRELSPLYTPKNSSLISTFKITDAEQAQLRTIVSQGEAARRHRVRQEGRRRAAGAVSHAASGDRNASAWAMKEAGKTWIEIAQQLAYKNPESARKAVNQWRNATKVAAE